MDDFGIGAAALACFNAVSMAMRRTGRTTRMLQSLGEHDRVVFRTLSEARYAQDSARREGKDLKFVVCDPKNIPALFDKGTPQGKTHFDHMWLEDYYRNAIDDSAKGIRQLQDELSGYGKPHKKTKESAEMISRFRIT